MVRSAQPRYGADGHALDPGQEADTTADDRSARSPIAIPSGCEVPQAAESYTRNRLQTELRVVSKTAGAQVIGQVGPLIPHEPVRVQVGLGRFVTLAWDDIRRVELPLPPTPTSSLRLSALPMPLRAPCRSRSHRDHCHPQHTRRDRCQSSRRGRVLLPGEGRWGHGQVAWTRFQLNLLEKGPLCWARGPLSAQIGKGSAALCRHLATRGSYGPNSARHCSSTYPFVRRHGAALHRRSCRAGALSCVQIPKDELAATPAKRHRRSAAAYPKACAKVEAAISAIVGRVGVGC